MEILGLSDPWIIGGYALSIICVVFCCAYALIKGRGGSEEEDEGDERRRRPRDIRRDDGSLHHRHPRARLVRIQEHQEQRGVPPRKEQGRTPDHRTVVRLHVPLRIRGHRIRRPGRRPRHVSALALHAQPLRGAHRRVPDLRRSHQAQGQAAGCVHICGPSGQDLQVEGDPRVHRDPHHRHDAHLRRGSPQGRSQLPRHDHRPHGVLRSHPDRVVHHSGGLRRIRRYHRRHVQRRVPGGDHVHRDGGHPRGHLLLLRRGHGRQQRPGGPLGHELLPCLGLARLLDRHTGRVQRMDELLQFRIQGVDDRRNHLPPGSGHRSPHPA